LIITQFDSGKFLFLAVSYVWWVAFPDHKPSQSNGTATLVSKTM